MVCIMAIVWWNNEDSDDEPTNHFSHLRTHFTYCVARYQLCPLEPQSCLEKEEPPQAAAPKKEDMFCWSNFHGPLDPKRNTPHTTFGGLWGQNSLSFQTNASWAAHQNHFNKLRNVSWGMEMSRNSFSKMGSLLRVVVTSQSGCQNKTSCYQNKKLFGWIFVLLIVSKPVFVGGNLQEILGDGIPPPDFLLQNCAPSIASIVTAELFEVKTMELIKPQGWGGGIPEAKAIRMARDDPPQ